MTGYVVAQCRDRSPGSAKFVVTALRSLLRYLFLAGHVRRQVAGAVPTVAHWGAGSPPRALPAETVAAETVAALLASCDHTTAMGRRDRAILVLLASLWLHRAVAGKLALDPPRVLAKARRNMARMRQVHASGRVQADFDAWEQLLDGPLRQLFDVLASASPRAVELRQNTPFAGVLTPAERAKALAAFRASWQAA